MDIQRRRAGRAAIRSRSPPQQAVARPYASGRLPGVKAACTFERPSENLISADYQSAVFRCFQKHRRYAVMKCGRIRQDGRGGFADFCLEDGRGRLKVKQAFRRPLFYRLRGTKANSSLRLFQADGEQAAQCVAQADFISLHESGAADSAFKNAACAEILSRLPQGLPPHNAVQNVQL